VKEGLVFSILKQAGMSREKFLELVKNKPKVSIIILNWNGQRCLQITLYRHAIPATCTSSLPAVPAAGSSFGASRRRAAGAESSSGRGAVMSATGWPGC